MVDEQNFERKALFIIRTSLDFAFEFKRIPIHSKILESTHVVKSILSCLKKKNNRLLIVFLNKNDLKNKDFCKRVKQVPSISFDSRLRRSNLERLLFSTSKNQLIFDCIHLFKKPLIKKHSFYSKNE